MDPSQEPRAYGAGRAGTPFDIVVFLKTPQVILRLLAWLFAIIVFACLAQEGFWNGTCRYNDSNACGYGIAIGVIAFLLAMGFTGLHIYFPNISNANGRKVVVLVEMIVSGIWTLLWFVGFCYMADQWRQEPDKDQPGWNGRNSVQAALAFTFFSILVWGALTFFAFRRFREGVSNLFSSDYQDHTANVPHSYATYPPNVDAGNFPQPPFTANEPMPSNYEPPVY